MLLPSRSLKNLGLVCLVALFVIALVLSNRDGAPGSPNTPTPEPAAKMPPLQSTVERLAKILTVQMGPTKDSYESMQDLMDMEWITCPKLPNPKPTKDKYQMNYKSAQLFLQDVRAIKQDHLNNTNRFYFHTATNPFLVQLLTKAQFDNDVIGACGEIGVHMGGFLLAIATAADVSDPLFMIDVFDLGSSSPSLFQFSPLF